MRKPGKPTDPLAVTSASIGASTRRIRFPRQSGPPAAHMLIPGWEMLGCGFFSVLRMGLLKGLVIAFVVVVVISLMVDLFRQKNG